MKRIGLLSRHARRQQFSPQHGPLRRAADDAEVREAATLAEDLFKNRPIGAVAISSAVASTVWARSRTGASGRSRGAAGTIAGAAAGKGVADASSMAAAIRLAADMAKKRRK